MPRMSNAEQENCFRQTDVRTYTYERIAAFSNLDMNMPVINFYDCIVWISSQNIQFSDFILRKGNPEEQGKLQKDKKHVD